MEALGFDFSGEAKVTFQKDVVDVARELGFDIPNDTVADEIEAELDILQIYRDLGFVIPHDDPTSIDELNEILEELQDLGFEIPTDMDIEVEPQPEIIDLDFD